MTWLLNPGNGSFASLCRSWCCVDKTRVLKETNRLMEEHPLTKRLITRPSHSGKSAFLSMLSALQLRRGFGFPLSDNAYRF